MCSICRVRSDLCWVLSCLDVRVLFVNIWFFVCKREDLIYTYFLVHILFVYFFIYFECYLLQIDKWLSWHLIIFITWTLFVVLDWCYRDACEPYAPSPAWAGINVDRFIAWWSGGEGGSVHDELYLWKVKVLPLKKLDEQPDQQISGHIVLWDGMQVTEAKSHRGICCWGWGR